MKAAQEDLIFWKGHFHCAVTLVAMREPEEALPQLELSLQIDPGNPLALHLIADLTRKISRVA